MHIVYMCYTVDKKLDSCVNRRRLCLGFQVWLCSLYGGGGGGGISLVLFPLRFLPHAFVGSSEPPLVSTHMCPSWGSERVCPLVFITCPVLSSVGIYEMNKRNYLEIGKGLDNANLSWNLGKIIGRILVVNPIFPIVSRHPVLQYEDFQPKRIIISIVRSAVSNCAPTLEIL